MTIDCTFFSYQNVKLFSPGENELDFSLNIYMFLGAASIYAWTPPLSNKIC